MKTIRVLKNIGARILLSNNEETRRGVSQEQVSRRAVIGNPTLIGAIMVRRGEADGLICGTVGSYSEHF